MTSAFEKEQIYQRGYDEGITRVLDILEGLDRQILEIVKNALYEEDYQKHLKDEVIKKGLGS